MYICPIYFFLFSLECAILLDTAELLLEFMIMLCGFADDTIWIWGGWDNAAMKTQTPTFLQWSRKWARLWCCSPTERSSSADDKQCQLGLAALSQLSDRLWSTCDWALKVLHSQEIMSSKNKNQKKKNTFEGFLFLFCSVKGNWPGTPLFTSFACSTHKMCAIRETSKHIKTKCQL